MRYVKTPGNVLLRACLTPEGQPSLYLFDTFLSEFVWKDKAWRTEELCDMAAGLMSKFSNPIPDKVIELTDKEHERLASTIQSAEINPAVLVDLFPFVRAIVGATRTFPDEPLSSHDHGV